MFEVIILQIGNISTVTCSYTSLEREWTKKSKNILDKCLKNKIKM